MSEHQLLPNACRKLQNSAGDWVWMSRWEMGQCLEVSPGSQWHQAGREWCLPKAGPGEWSLH